MRAVTQSALHARLAGFYFFYYATVGAFMPYWSPYLEHRGFSAAQMGIAYACMGLTRMFMPPLWGWWADRTGNRLGLIRWTVIAALVLFMGIPFAPSIVLVAALMVLYSIFWHALLSQFEAAALQHLSHTKGEYGLVRLWGSVGFVAAVLGLGPILDAVGIAPLPWLVGVMFAAMAVAAWMVPETVAPPAGTQAGPSVMSVLKRPEVLALLAACVLSQLSFAPYYNFFTLFLERHHYTRGMAGFLWSLAVIAEIVLFVWMSRLIARVGARRLMMAVLGATALRWVLTPLVVDSLGLLIVLQLSHALTFGAYHSLAVHYIQRFFPGSLQGRGQAFYNAAAYGLGGSIGSLGAGYIWEAISPEAVFYFSASAAALGWWIARRWLPAEAPPGGA